MRRWLREHRHALGAALARFAEQRTASLLNALVIGVALALPAGGYALLANLRALTQRFTLEPELTVFMRVEATRADADALGARLRSDARVRSVRFTSREAALKELRETAGLGDVVAALDYNPLPDAFVVRARDPQPAALEALAAELRAVPSVAEVQVDSAWARRLAALLDLGRLAVALLAALLGVALVAVTFNTIRLQILTRRDEIEISKLIGATDAFVRRPFFYLGLLQGAAGGLLAAGILWAALAALNVGVRELAQAYGSDFQLGFLRPAEAAALLAFSAALGWLGAYLSVSKYLREIEPK
ncbi:MAG: permease-like cell division protein FtsX [Betaproteobacteria bacterium]|nr:permease-like cell division protein FtsX [Betaproteobacteria bacterium]